eukprot:bmy_10960T0
MRLCLRSSIIGAPQEYMLSCLLVPTLNRSCLVSSCRSLALNLQAAIGAYYDFESPNISVPSMSFVEDVTIGEGESIPPDTQFIKTWRIQNSVFLANLEVTLPWMKMKGDNSLYQHLQLLSCYSHAVLSSCGAEAWPPGVCLKYVGGDQFGHVNMVMVRSLEPQEIADVSVQMCSPSRAGMYQGQWRMCTATGLYYGVTVLVYPNSIQEYIRQLPPDFPYKDDIMSVNPTLFAVFGTATDSSVAGTPPMSWPLLPAMTLRCYAPPYDDATVNGAAKEPPPPYVSA